MTGRRIAARVGAITVGVVLGASAFVGTTTTPATGAPRPTATTAAASVLTGTGSQNPNLTVTLTVTPAAATTGTLVSLTSKIKNNTRTAKTVTVQFSLTDPLGGVRSYTLGTTTINGGKTSSNSYSYTVLSTALRGNHVLTSSATESGCPTACTSTASVTLPIS